MTSDLTVGAGEQLVAHHPLLVAVPAFVPAIVVVGVVIHIARKDRRDEAQERALIERALEKEDE